MMARVAGVMAASIRARSMLRVTGSMSTKTGRAPTSRMTLLVATQESGVVMTSWPGPMPAMRSAISIVHVPEVKARTGRPPKNSESLASNSFALGPDVIQPERRTSTTPAMVSSSMVGRVNGRNGAADLAISVGTDMSGLVAEKPMVLGLGEQMISEGLVAKKISGWLVSAKGGDVFFPGHGVNAAGLFPKLSEYGVVDEPVA